MSKVWFLKFTGRSPFYYGYSFVDTEKHIADEFFKRHKVKVEYEEEYTRDDVGYRISFCRVKKQKSKAFEQALAELPSLMKERGHADYEDFCATVNTDLQIIVV